MTGRCALPTFFYIPMFIDLSVSRTGGSISAMDIRARTKIEKARRENWSRASSRMTDDEFKDLRLGSRKANATRCLINPSGWTRARARARECSSAVIELVVGHNFHVKRGQGYFIRNAPGIGGEWTRRKKIDAVRRGASLIVQLSKQCSFAIHSV